MERWQLIIILITIFLTGNWIVNEINRGRYYYFYELPVMGDALIRGETPISEDMFDYLIDSNLGGENWGRGF